MKVEMSKHLDKGVPQDVEKWSRGRSCVDIWISDDNSKKRVYVMVVSSMMVLG